MADATSIGSVQLDLEVNAELDKNLQEQVKQIAERVRKMFANMDMDMFKGLTQGFEDAMKSMTETIKEHTEMSKRIMRSFVEELAKMKISIPSMNDFDEAEDQKRPLANTATSNKIRGSPGISIRKPIIKLDPQFDTDMFEQKYAELENMMDMYDNQIMQKQTERKRLIESYSPNMNNDMSMKLDKQVMALDIQITKLQDAASRTSITLSAMDRKMITTGSVTAGTSSKIREMAGVLSGMKGKLAVISFSVLQKGLSMIIAGLKRATSAVGAFIKKLATNMLQKFGNGLKNLGKKAVSLAGKMLGLGSSSKKASNGMGRAHMGVGQLIKSFTIFSLIFPLVSRGIMALGESIKSSLMTNQQFANSCNQIKTNLMAAFMPIYQAILPALNALMSAIAKVTAMFAGFISNLFGKTYSDSVNAAQGLVDAKDAMGAYGNAAKDTAKKLGALGQLDEINVLSANNEKSGGAGSSALVITPTDVNQSSISEFTKKIKEMWEKEDFSGIGKLLGEKINKAVSSFTKWISWDNVGKSITKFITSFCDLFNSLIESINWENIGIMFGTGIDTIARTIRQLMEGIDWQQIGRALANGLNGLAHSVDWDNLGRTIGSFFQARINALYGFVTTADWPSIGKALADGVMGIIDSISWDTAAAAIGKGLSGLISSAHNFVTNIDWTDLGSKIASTINTFFSNVNWADFGMTVSDAITGILNMLLKAVRDTDWSAIGHDIGDFIVNLDWAGIIWGLGELIVELVVGLSEGIGAAFIDIAKAMWDGLCQGISDFFRGIGTWVKEHIVDPFINAVKDFFGIHSPSTVMSEIGGFLIQGLIDGIGGLIGTLVGSVANWFGSIGETIGNTWESIKETAGNAWEGITSTIGEAWDGLKKGASDTWENIKSGVSSTWDNIKEGAGSAWDGIKSGIGGFISDIADNISTGFGGAKNNALVSSEDTKTGVLAKFRDISSNLSGLPKTLSSIGSDMFSRMKDGVNGTIGDVKNAISRGMDDATSDMKNLSTKSSTWGSDMISGMANGIRSAAGNITNAVSNITSKITSFLHFSRPDEGPLREYETWMPDMVEGLSKTLIKSSPSLINNVKGIALAMSKAMVIDTPDIAFAGHRDLDISSVVKQDVETIDKQDTIISYLSLILMELSKDKDIMCSLQVVLGDEKFKELIVRLNRESIAQTGKPLLG